MLKTAVTGSWSGFKHKWVDNLKTQQQLEKPKEENKKIKEEVKWPTEIAFLDLDNNPVTEEELTRTLEESTLWMVEDSRLGYNLEDDESYMRFKNANFYGIGHDVAIPVAGAPQPKDWVGEIVNAQGTLELQRLPPSKSCMERPLRTLRKSLRLFAVNFFQTI